MELKRLERAAKCAICGPVQFFFVSARTAPRGVFSHCPNAPDDRRHFLEKMVQVGIDTEIVELFPELGRVSDNRPTYARIGTGLRFAVLQRDGFRCVFCRRLVEVRANPAYELDRASTVVISDVREAFPMRPIEESQQDFGDRLLFGAEADHIFDVTWHSELFELVPKQKLASIRRKCGKEWLVATCPECNGGRHWASASMKVLFEIYARHLFERSGAPDFADLDDFRLTLEKYAFLRRTRGQQSTERSSETG
jgi:hypothetical protein